MQIRKILQIGVDVRNYPTNFIISSLWVMSFSGNATAQVVTDFYFDDESHLNCIASNYIHGSSVEDTLSKVKAYCNSNVAAGSRGICAIGAVGGLVPSGRYDYPKYVEVQGTHGGGADCSNPVHGKVYVRKEVLRNNYRRPLACAAQDKGGNPIDFLTGEKIQPVDLGFGVGGMRASLTYRSPVLGGATPAGNRDTWTLSLQRQLFMGTGWDNELLQVDASQGDGSHVSFTSNGSTWRAAGDKNNRLTRKDDGWLLTNLATGRLETYGVDGQIVNVAEIGGGVLSYTYAADDGGATVMSIRDTYARELAVSYRDGVPYSIKQAGGSALVDFSYDQVGSSKNRLAKITWPDAYEQQMLYEYPKLPYHLSGVKDEGGVRVSTFTYDAKGSAISTERAGGVWKYSRQATGFPYVESQSATYSNGIWFSELNWNYYYPTITVSSPNGQTSVHSPSTVGGALLFRSRSQPAGSGCSASTSTQEYDTNGALAWREDFNGQRICYANDASRNVETVRVEGLAAGTYCASLTTANATLPANSRKVSTQWHPAWNKPIKVAEPRRLTTSVYNGQPDPFNGGAVASCAPGTATLPDGSPIVVLCKQVEQATTDTNGALGFAATLAATSDVPTRVQQWTYNQYGQVLTATDPLNNTTTYSYYPSTSADYTMGDLATVTNALQQVTARYTQYEPMGQWLQMVDANGVTTTRTFDARQRLKTTTTAGLTTRYDYWPTGLLKSVTLPDTSFVAYGYDDAHRLTSVSDNLGNKITYTLDNSGNRISESVTDPTGRLAKTLTRVPDALNRIQQIVGRE